MQRSTGCLPAGTVCSAVEVAAQRLHHELKVTCSVQGGGSGAASRVRGAGAALQRLPTSWHCVLSSAGGSTVLAVCRAAALVQRAWAGDLVQAVADCERAAHLCPGHAKAHQTRVMALRAMKQLQAAYEEAQRYRDRFPDGAGEMARLREELYGEIEQRSCSRDARLQRKRNREVRSSPESGVQGLRAWVQAGTRPCSASVI